MRVLREGQDLGVERERRTLLRNRRDHWRPKKSDRVGMSVEVDG